MWTVAREENARQEIGEADVDITLYGEIAAAAAFTTGIPTKTLQ